MLTLSNQDLLLVQISKKMETTRIKNLPLSIYIVAFINIYLLIVP